MKSDVQHVAIDAVSRVLKETGVRFTRVIKPSRKSGGGSAEFRLGPRREALAVEYHPGLTSFQLNAVLERLKKEVGPKQRLALCVRRMTWSLLDTCKESGVALFDLEGNAYVRLPGLYIERFRPSRENAPEPASGTVFTAKAMRLVRAFLKRYPHDWRQSRLVRETGLSAGYVSILTKRLVEQGYVCDRFGMLYLDDPERLLNDWVAHYRFDRHRRLSFAISAGNYGEGVKKLGDVLTASGNRFAWTGWTGAFLRTPYAIPANYTAYVAKRPGEMKGVFPVEKQGNVTLYVPHDEGVFQFTTLSDAGEIVSDGQLYVDLCRMPGRAKEQADALRHEHLDFAGMTT